MQDAEAGGEGRERRGGFCAKRSNELPPHPHPLALICANTYKEEQNGEGSWEKRVGSETTRELVFDSSNA